MENKKGNLSGSQRNYSYLLHIHSEGLLCFASDVNGAYYDYAFAFTRIAPFSHLFPQASINSSPL